MCVSNSCGCGGNARTSLTDVLLAVAAGILWPIAKAAGGVALIAAIAAWRWTTGAPMWGGRAWLLAGWPRWQRAVARLVATAPAVTAIWWPTATAAVVAVLVAGTGTASLVARRRAAVRTRPIRVIAAVRPPAAAIGHQPPTADRPTGARDRAGVAR